MDKLFGLEHTHSQNEDLKLLVTAYSQPELLVITSMLQDAEIPYLLRERGAGNYLKVLAGFSVFGTDVYVHRDDFDTAGELLTALPEEEGEIEEETETE